jgi:hypothetical protein
MVIEPNKTHRPSERRPSAAWLGIMTGNWRINIIAGRNADTPAALLKESSFIQSQEMVKTFIATLDDIAELFLGLMRVGQLALQSFLERITTESPWVREFLNQRIGQALSKLQDQHFNASRGSGHMRL